MTQQSENPNQYQLTSNEVQVTYTLSNDNGQPELGYQGSQGVILLNWTTDVVFTFAQNDLSKVSQFVKL